MQTVLIILAVYFLAELIAYLFYIPRMKLWFYGYKKQEKLKNDKKAKFALVIPARRESVIIKRLFDSIKEQTYGKENFDVYVIVDDKNDKTIELANQTLTNVRTLVLENQTRKAEALDYCFQTILADKSVSYDNYIIIDADNELSPNFLEEMNNAIVSGADVIIPRKTPINWKSKDKKLRTLSANCSAMTWPGVDTMGNKGKCKTNSTLALCGQGMMLSHKVIAGLGGYPFRSITEDYEIAYECICKGYNQFFYEHAIIYSEEAITHKEFNKRRMRWIKGFTQFTSKYNKKVKELAKKDPEVKRKTHFFLYGLYPLYALCGATGVFFFGLLIYGIVLACKCDPAFYWPFIGAGICLAHFYLQFFIYGLICLTQDKDTNRMTKWEKFKVLFLSPFITMEYVYIFIFAFITPYDFLTWKPVERVKF